MQRAKFLATLILVPMVLAPAGFAATITFDDITTPFTNLATISPYQGFTWTNFTSYDTTVTSGGFPGGIVSSPDAVLSGGEFNDGGVVEIVGSITSTTPFTLNSGFFGAGWLPGQQLLVTASNGFSETLTLNTTGAQQFVFNQTGLTEVDFTPIANSGTSDPFGCGTFNCTQFTLDNLVVNEAVPAGAPEPATAALVTTCLAGLLFLKRRITH
jgi:hypothetical protein